MFELGQEVNYKKYGSVQVGLITGIKRTGFHSRIETLDGGVEDGESKRETVKYRLRTVLKNGNESQEWLTEAQLQARIDAS